MLTVLSLNSSRAKFLQPTQFFYAPVSARVSKNANESSSTSGEYASSLVTADVASAATSTIRLLDIEVANGTVTFRGTVASFYERRLCLTCQHVPGVRKEVNDLKVKIPSPADPNYRILLTHAASTPSEKTTPKRNSFDDPLQ